MKAVTFYGTVIKFQTFHTFLCQFPAYLSANQTVRQFNVRFFEKRTKINQTGKFWADL